MPHALPIISNISLNIYGIKTLCNVLKKKKNKFLSDISFRVDMAFFRLEMLISSAVSLIINHFKRLKFLGIIPPHVASHFSEVENVFSVASTTSSSGKAYFALITPETIIPELKEGEGVWLTIRTEGGSIQNVFLKEPYYKV